MMDLGKVAAHYGGRGSGQQCNIPTPGHSKSDLGTSLTIMPGAPDGLLVKCHNGDAKDALAVKDQLRRDGFLPELARTSERSRDVAAWDYTDAHGAVLYRKVRMALVNGDKSYRFEHPDGRGGWRQKRGNAAQVPYRLPDLVNATKDAPIYMTEGEKQADKLASWGFVATSSKDWRGFDFSGYVRGRTVIILPDNDEEGARVAQAATAAVEKAEGRAVMLQLPGLPHKGDVMDWTGTADDLRQLTDRALAGSLLPIATLDLAALAQTRAEAQRFTIERIAPSGEVTLFIGPGSAGKSLLAQQLATASAAGIDCLGLRVEPCPAIYITCEDSAEQLHWRQQHICEGLRVPMATLAGKLHLASLRGLLDNVLTVEAEKGVVEPGPAYQRLVATIKATRAGLVFLDNVAHLFAGNENDRGEVTQFVNLLNRLAGETGAAVVLLGHPNKAGDEWSGSTAWSNAVRSRVYLEHDAETDMRKLSLPKSNYGKKGEVVTFRWHEWAFVRDEDLPADTRAEMDATIKIGGENEAFLRCLRARAATPGREVGPSVGPNYAPARFAEMTEAKGLRKEALARAMERLFHTGAIVTEQVKRKGSETKTIIVEAGPGTSERPSERLPNTPSEPFRTAVRTLPRTHPISKDIHGAASWPAAPDDDDLDWSSGEAAE